MEWIVYLLVTWATGCVFNGVIASRTGRSVAHVVAASILLSPLLVWMYLAATPQLGYDNTTGAQQGDAAYLVREANEGALYENLR